MFPADEIEDFNTTCIKFKLNPEDFLIKAEKNENQLPVYQEDKFVLLIYVPKAIIKKYYAGHVSNWNYLFEEDVKKGIFKN